MNTVGPVPDYATGHVQHAASSAYGPKTPPGYDQRPPPGYGQQPPPGYGQQPPPGYDESAHQGYGNVQPPPGHYGMQGSFPMTTQPGMPAPPGAEPVVWMARPQPVAGCPPGLEYLTAINQLIVKQQFELLQVITGWEAMNKYKIKNNQGQQIYFAKEDADASQKQICQTTRGFEIHVTDNMGQEVILVRREFKCCTDGWCRGQWCACCDCCAFEIEVEAPVGTIVGYVTQKASVCSSYYSVMDASRTEILDIEGPICIAFEQLSISNVRMYEVPINLDVKMKAVMIGAVFLIDIIFFDDKPTPSNQNHGYH